jgi:hypothetical protein
VAVSGRPRPTSSSSEEASAGWPETRALAVAASLVHLRREGLVQLGRKPVVQYQPQNDSGPPAVYLASAAARELTGRRLVATTWSREQPDGAPAVAGFGEDARSAR